MATNKTIRRQQAAAAAAAEQAAVPETVEEVTGDALDTSTDSEVPGSALIDQDSGLVEGDQPAADSAEGSDAPEGVTEQSQAVVMRGGSELVATLEEMPFLPPAGDEPATLGEGTLVEVTIQDLSDVVVLPNDLQPETPVSDEEQAAATAALLEQDAQPEPDAPATEGKPVRLLDALLGQYVEGAPQPVINLEVGGQMGFDPTLAPDGDAKADEGSGEPVGELPPAEGGAEGADLSALEESAEDEQAALNTAEPQVDPANSDPLYVDPEAASVVEEGEPDYTTYSDGRLRAVLLPMVGQIPSEAWSREDMLLYLIKGVYPSKTGRNNWIYDARRSHRVKAWTASEILDFIEGKLQLDAHVDETTAWEEAYARYKAPSSWTIEAFKEYVCNGSVPEYTAKGVLINDRQRDQKQVHHLTFRELRAALLGEIATQFKHEQLLSQYRKRLGISESYSEERLLAEMPNQPDEVSMDNSILRAKLDEYKVAISKNPGTLTEVTAGACQGMLYKAIRQVTKREFNEFVEGWNIILDFVNENYTALFDPYKARRGWSEVALSKSQLQLFEDLLTVIIATREPGNRASQLSHNLEIVLRHLPEENERQNFFMYYNPAGQ